MSALDSGDIDRALSQLDALGDAETLRVKAAEFTAAHELVPASRYNGSDPSQSIWVDVDPRGRVLGVDISRTWSDRLQPAEFGDALFGAYTTAVQKAFATELAAGRIKQATEPTVDSPSTDPSTSEWLTAVQARLDRIDDELRRLPDGPAEPDREVRSPNGYVTLRLEAGSLSAIVGNTAALERANRELLTEDVLDVFRRANLTSDR